MWKKKMILLQAEWGMINLSNVEVSKKNLHFQRSYTHMIPKNAPKGAE